MNFNNDQHLDLDSPISPITSHELGNDSSLPTLATTSSSSIIVEEMESEQVPLLMNTGTISVRSGNENDIPSQENSIEVSPNWDPMAISTPIITTASRSDKDIENELFHDIEEIVRKFIRRPSRHYPYYRVIRWVEGDHPKLEYVLTVVINEPTVISERQG